MRSAADVLEGRTGHESEAERVLEAEAERLEEELGPDHMLDDREERDRLWRLGLIRRVDRFGERVTALEAALDSIGDALRRLHK